VAPAAKENYDKNGARSLTKYLQKGDYLRLKTLTVAYNVPKNISRKLAMENLKVYVSATNLWTLTDFTGFDPETASNPNILPSVKSYNVGVSVTF
jgi:uncharacterized protein YneR